MIIKSFLWTLSIYPTLLSTVTATGQTIPSLSASSAIPSASPPPPAVHLLAPNWTRLDASGPRNRIQWGGFGRSDILSGIASLDWEFKMDGKKWWLEVFDMKVLKPTGDWLAMTNEQWNAQAAANVEATKTLKCTIEVSGTPVSQYVLTAITRSPWITPSTTGIVTAAGCVTTS